MNLKYVTAGGYERVVKDVSKGVISDNKTYMTYKAANGRTYHWFGVSVVDGRVVEDVLTIESKSNWCRHLGTECKYEK